MSPAHWSPRSSRQKASPRSSRQKALPLAFALSFALGACHDEPKSNASASPSISAAGETAVDPAVRNPDPIVTKTYRLEECYYASLAFRQARNAYLGSLGDAEPGPGKIPDFAVSEDKPALAHPQPPVGSSGTPAGSAAAPPTAKPATSAAKAPAPKSSASASAPSSSALADGKGKQMPNHAIRTVRYEYYARLCKTAAGIKTPEAPEVDGIVEDFTGYALGHAKDLTDANMYYEKGDYKDDNFARGKDMHARLVNDFKALDGQEAKLWEAVKGFEDKNSIDKSGWTDGQKLADDVVIAGRDVLVDFDSSKTEAAKVKADLERLHTAKDALAAFGKQGDNAQDPFYLILTGPATSEAKRGRCDPRCARSAAEGA